LGYSTGEDEGKKRTRGDNDDAGNDGGGNSKRTRAAATAAAAGAGGGAGDERNKRFGALLFGHIKKAKTTLERDATLIEKRKTVENKLAAEQEKLASTLHQMERKMAEDERSERAKHAVQVRLDALKRRQVDVQAAGQVHKAALLPLAAVLLTETQPQLSWLPASHNAATQALLDARVEKIGAEIRRREEDDGRLVDDLEEDIRALQQTLHGDDGDGDGDGDGDENGHDAEAGKDGVTLSEYKARMQKRREEREEALKNVDLRETLRGGRDFAWGGQGFNDGGRGGGVGGGGHRGYDNRGDRGGFAPHRGPDLRDLREPPRRRGDHDELGRDRRPPAPRRRDREAVHNEVEGEVDRRPLRDEDDEDGDFDRRPLQNADNEEDGEGGRRPPQDDAPAHDVEEEDEDEDEDEVIVYFT